MPRVDDRRVISGIVHVLRSGGRWADAPTAYGPRKTFYNRYVRWAVKGVWRKLFEALAAEAGAPSHVMIDSSAVKAHRSAAGGRGGSAARRSAARVGRTTKIHALTDRLGRPIAFRLTGGQVADCSAGAALLADLSAARMLHGDKGYDSDPIRRQVEAAGVTPNIPKTNRRWKPCFSSALYRNRNAIERMFCRLKDFHRVATRYDRLTTSFLAAVHIAAIVSYWL